MLWPASKAIKRFVCALYRQEQKRRLAERLFDTLMESEEASLAPALSAPSLLADSVFCSSQVRSEKLQGVEDALQTLEHSTRSTDGGTATTSVDSVPFEGFKT